MCTILTTWCDSISIIVLMRKKNVKRIWKTDRLINFRKNLQSFGFFYFVSSYWLIFTLRFREKFAWIRVFRHLILEYYSSTQTVPNEQNGRKTNKFRQNYKFRQGTFDINDKILYIYLNINLERESIKVSNQFFDWISQKILFS